tara:strand:- start:179 stop:412 length:234 start_codon:yes stop_codon:yes gene_type:complete
MALELVESTADQTEKERLQELNMLTWLMHTPLNKLPAMPSHATNEDNTKLGNQILELLEEGKITISGMDNNGLLIVK